MNWFSILKPNGTVRPAYTALQGMGKRYRSWSAWGMAVRPSALTLLSSADEPGWLVRKGVVDNSGTEVWSTWSLVTATTGLTFTVAPTNGAPGSPFTMQINAPGQLGVYSGVITATASDPRVPQSPFTVPLTLHVVPEVHRVHLPLVLRQGHR